MKDIYSDLGIHWTERECDRISEIKKRKVFKNRQGGSRVGKVRFIGLSDHDRLLIKEVLGI